MKKSISKFLFLLVLSSNLFSQVNQEWVRIYNGLGYTNVSTSMEVDKQGNTYICGYSATDYDPETYDYLILKYNSNGVKIFDVRFNGISNKPDIACDLHYDGNFIYVTGYSFKQSGTAILTLKLNLSGQVVWSRYYSDSNYAHNAGYSVSSDATGNVYVCGYSSPVFTIGYLRIIKYFASGDIAWTQIYSDHVFNQSYGVNMRTDLNGNIYVSASCSGASPASWHLTTIKYNTNGLRMWVNRHDSTLLVVEASNCLFVKPDGKTYHAGNKHYTTVDASILILNYDQNGSQLGSILYPPQQGGHFSPSEIYVDSFNNIYVTGYGWTNNENFVTLKFNPDYSLDWAREYDGYTYYDEAFSLAVDGTGCVYATGITRTVNNWLGDDYCTIKYNGNGELEWALTYNSPSNRFDKAICVRLDSINNVYVTGFCNVIGDINNIVTIKYSQSIGIQPISNQIPAHFSLSQNYPNPFNPKTRIKFSIPTPLNPPFGKGGRTQSGGFVTLIIYDILGREITTLVNQQLKPGSYEVEWDASNNPSGVYFYKLISGEFTETKKMVLLK